jgi:hypothetical protein
MSTLIMLFTSLVLLHDFNYVVPKKKTFGGETSKYLYTY